VSMRAATKRQIGPAEAVTPERALQLFLGRPDAPATPRRIAAGEPADLCLLKAPITTVLAEMSSDLVAATVIAGQLS